jgi:MFS family permease
VGLASSWGQVLAIRFTDRVGKGIRTSPRDALLADLVPADRRGRAFGLQRAMDNAGAVVGPLLAAFLLKFVLEDERSVFLLAAIPGLAAVLLLLFGVKERPRQPAPMAPEPRDAPGHGPLPRRLWTAIAIFVLFTLASSTDAFLILRARDAGIELWQLPLLWAFFNAVKAIAGIPGGALADRLGRVPAISIGWAVYAAAYVGFAYVAKPSQVWALLGFYALFYAMTEGAERALVADLAPAHLRGRAFGAFHASIGLAALPASVLFGLLWKLFGPRAAFLIGAAIAIVALTALLALRTRFTAARIRPRPETDTISCAMGPVWRLIKGQKDMCQRCGREIVDFPAVGRVVDFQFQPGEKYCWDCYRYLTPFVDEVAPVSQDPFQPVTKPAIP